ncbi:MAG: flagellar biosynthesis protein FlhA [Spirochaetales bacterium]|nr:flagellar biosynthesis protein FlhA [Spirochaetales bacterium]
MADENKRGSIVSILQNNIVPVAIVLCVFLLFIPIPKIFVDLSMILNLALSVIILLVVVQLPRPSDFQTFPRVILFQTLFSLGINISSTRLILAGQIQNGELIGQSAMVNAFASIVAGDNLVVGFVIFIILIVVQVLVVTKGAGRVSEVAARFSLDSMNQKLFDIDNRLNSGVIDEQQAELLKEEIRRDIDFYSNMDGSSKFVSGNVKAGIVITIVNLIGGIIAGTVLAGDRALTVTEAIQTYSRLTIGDGLTSQLPSLIISFATGLLVTGTKSEETFDQQLKKEFAVDGRIYQIVSVVLLVAGVVFSINGQPSLLAVLLPVGGLLFYIGIRMSREETAKKMAVAQAQTSSQASAQNAGQSEGEPIVMLDPLSLELGYALIPLVDKDKGAELLDRISRIRIEARHDIGLDIPKIRIQDNMTLEPNDYSFKIEGIEAGHASVRLGYVMAMDTGDVLEKMDGEATKDPTFGMEAIWLPEEKRSEAESRGYVVVDAPTIISTHITEIIRWHAAEMINRQSVSVILEKVKEKNAVLVDEVLNTLKISYGTIEKVLQNLLAEKVSIRNYVKILETIANYAHVSQNPWDLTAKVREALGLQICMQYVDPEEKKLRVMRLSQELTELVQQRAYVPPDGSAPYVGFDPVESRRWHNAFEASMGRISKMGFAPIILCVSPIRQLVHSAIEREIPGAVVLSDMEVYAAGKNVKVEIIDEITDVEI